MAVAADVVAVFGHCCPGCCFLLLLLLLLSFLFVVLVVDLVLRGHDIMDMACLHGELQ